MTVVMHRNADAAVVKTNVESAVTSLFDITNWDMGEALYLSVIYEAINKIDGVAYIDVFTPADNILATGKLREDDPSALGVASDEVITLGTRDIKYYYEI